MRIAQSTPRRLSGNDGHDAVAGVLHLAAVELGEAAAHDRIMGADELGRHPVAEARGHLGRADDVGEQDGAVAGIDAGCAPGRTQYMEIGDAAEERFDRGERHLHHFAGDVAVRFAVHALRRFLVRRVDQAEGGAARFVEPVGHVADAILVLDLEVLLVRLRDFRGGHALEVVAVHENGH